MKTNYSVTETEEERKARIERIAAMRRRRTETDKALDKETKAEGKTEEGHSGAMEASGEWDGLREIGEATQEGTFKPDKQAQEAQENKAVENAAMTAAPLQKKPEQTEETPAEAQAPTTEATPGELEVPEMKTETDEEQRSETEGTPDEEETQSGMEMPTEEQQTNGTENEKEEPEQPSDGKKEGYEYNGQVYGAGELDLSHDPVAAIVVMHSGGMNTLSEETIQAMNEWAEESDGIRAVLGILTDENMQEYATIGENGKLIEKNNRNAHSIFISNYTILGNTLSKFAMKLGDPDFPPELYGDAVGTLLTIVEKAEADGSSGNGKGYDEYIQNNKGSKEVMALVDAFGFCDELFTKKNGLDETMNAAIREAQDRCKAGKGTDADYALLEMQVPELTDDEKEKDLTYNKLMSRYDQEDKNSYEAGYEDSWLNQQTVKNLTANGYEPDLLGIEAASYKDIMLGCRQEAVDMVAEYAHKMGYSDMGTFMKETGFTEEMLDELALRNYRVFEKTFAAPENAQALQELIGSGEEEEHTQPTTEADLIRSACRGFGAGVVGYMAEGFEAFYTWTQSTNIPTDSARVRNKYTAEYGIFGGERELYNELMGMCEEGFFPNESMNEFVKNYLEKGGNPYLLGIVPDELGWVAETANNLNDMKEVNDEWSEELNGMDKTIYNFFSWTGEQATGMLVENKVLNPMFLTAGTGKATDALTMLVSSGAGWYNKGSSKGMQRGMSPDRINIYSMVYGVGSWIGSCETVSSNATKAAYSMAVEGIRNSDLIRFFTGVANSYKELPEEIKHIVETGGKGMKTIATTRAQEIESETMGNALGKGLETMYNYSDRTETMKPSDELIESVNWFYLY